MKRIWRSGGEDSLDRRLRAMRPEPRQSLVEEIERTVRGPVGARRRVPRFGFAVALTAALVAALGATGGMGYAASGMKGFALTAKKAFDPSPDPRRSAPNTANANNEQNANIEQNGDDESGREHWQQARRFDPAAAQYGRQRQPVCHNGRTLFLPPPAFQAHLRHGDTAGPCPS